MRGLIVVCALMVTSMLVNNCTKSEKPVITGDSMVDDKVPIERRGVMDVKSVTCGCAIGQATCSANCWFSECCICFNPSTHEAGCGCYLGFSSCKTESLNKSTPQVNAAVKEHIIHLKDHRIKTFFEYLGSKGIGVKELKAQYGVLTSNPEGRNIKDNEARIQVGSVKYNAFMRSYTAFVESLDPGSRNIISTYLKSKK